MPKSGGLLWPFFVEGGELGPHLTHKTQCRLGRCLYLRTKWHLDPSSRLATIDMGREVGAAVPLFGELGHHLTQCDLGRGPTSVVRTKRHIDPSNRLATIPTLKDTHTDIHTDRQATVPLRQTVLQTEPKKSQFWKILNIPRNSRREFQGPLTPREFTGVQKFPVVLLCG